MVLIMLLFKVKHIKSIRLKNITIVYKPAIPAISGIVIPQSDEVIDANPLPSQSLPVKPCVQLQKKEPLVLIHLAPL